MGRVTTNVPFVYTTDYLLYEKKTLCVSRTSRLSLVSAGGTSEFEVKAGLAHD